MKVLHVYKQYYPVMGGIENHIRLLAAGQRERGIEVEVLVAGDGPRSRLEHIDGIKVVKAGTLLSAASTPLSPAIALYLQHSDADLIHLHFPYPIGESAFLLAGRERPMVLTYHSDIVRQKSLLRLYRPVLRRVLARANRIIATSPQYVRSSEFLPDYEDKVRVVPLGIDVERYESINHPVVDAVHERYGTPMVLFVGRLRYYKGLEFLIRAMRDVEANLVIVGTGPEERNLRDLTDQLNLSEKVCFSGEVSDEEVAAYYQACDLFVLPSCLPSEAFGVVQLEAMACGKPVVCTELGTGTSYVNVDGETGLVVPPCDSDALAHAIKLILSDKEASHSFGENALRRVKEKFGKDVMVEGVIEVYREIRAV
jgi:glycosyltransferase involved in cell wall biosynthesis